MKKGLKTQKLLFLNNLCKIPFHLWIKILVPFFVRKIFEVRSKLHDLQPLRQRHLSGLSGQHGAEAVSAARQTPDTDLGQRELAQGQAPELAPCRANVSATVFARLQPHRAFLAAPQG
jgi:hypothetical protein